MLNRKMWVFAFLFMVLMGLIGCGKKTDKIMSLNGEVEISTAEAVEVPMVTSTPTSVAQEPISLTITSMSWHRGGNIYKSGVFTSSGWEMPTEVITYTVEQRINHYDTPAQYHNWYKFTVPHDNFVRRVDLEGLGTDPLPTEPDYELAENEFLYYEWDYYYIQLTDEKGQIWWWGPRNRCCNRYGGYDLFQEPEAGEEYLKYEVGMQVLATWYFETSINFEVYHMVPLKGELK